MYGDPTGDSADSVMFTRFSSGTVLDLVVRFLALADAVAVLPDAPVLLADEAQRPHLPAVLRADAVVVRSGSDVEAAIRNA